MIGRGQKALLVPVRTPIISGAPVVQAAAAAAGAAYAGVIVIVLLVFTSTSFTYSFLMILSTYIHEKFSTIIITAL